MKKKSASKSAFFKLRVLVGVLLAFAAITVVLFALGKASAQPRTAPGISQPTISAQYRGVMPVVKFDISPPLRKMKPLTWKECTKDENEERDPIPLGPVGPVVRDPVVQRVMGKIGIPVPIISFDGNSNLCGCSPPDPNGSYYRWAIATGNGNNFPDYPKAGMWPDAYYFSTREFAGGSTFVGVGAYALDRAQALVGNPNPTVVGFLAPPSPAYVVGDGLLPSDLDGMTPPPAGSPNYFVGSEDNNGPYGAPADALTIWKFHYDPAMPNLSTFTLTNTLPTSPFNSILALCGGGRACIPQPGTANKIDHLGYRQRPLFRLAYRNFGSHESLVTNQSVSAGTGSNGEVSGIRWWELRSPNSSPVIFQEGTYAPGLTDGIHRWMGSIAMNSLGDIALGFSASNGTNPSTFPSVFYTARHDGDPPGQMTLGEGSIKDGVGSQTGSNRWGDYTAMVVDPTDDTTFWYINEYLSSTGAVPWR